MSQKNVLQLPTQAELFYKDVMRVLYKNKLRFLVGGSLALAHYMHLPRRPKDLDIFLAKEEVEPILAKLEENGYKTEMIHPHWLAKAYKDDLFIDFIFSSGNGVAKVDSSWYQNARSSKLFGVPVKLCAPEEILWSKAFIMERERFDGADIAHLLREAGDIIDWDRLMNLFGDHYRVLLAHVLLFDFIYPVEKQIIPNWVLSNLMDRVYADRLMAVDERICHGTLLSREQYLADIELHGFADGRIGQMTEAEIAEYIAAVRLEKETAAAAKKEKDGQAA